MVRGGGKVVGPRGADGVGEGGWGEEEGGGRRREGQGYAVNVSSIYLGGRLCEWDNGRENVCGGGGGGGGVLQGPRVGVGSRLPNTALGCTPIQYTGVPG